MIDIINHRRLAMKDIRIGDIIHNFQVKAITPVNDISAVIYEMEHLGTGTQVVWSKRDEEVKTCLIGFRTIPEDDTGSFHILEHSVLSGSAKYPSKELFLELMMGTYNTYLDAMTASDKTVYLLGSRSEKQFTHLLDTQMDCVFRPAIYDIPNIFRQEGWHYELLNREDPVIYKGIVYNEMKGSHSSPSSVISKALDRLMLPDTCYRYDSGGDPVHIPELTYEKFLSCHSRYYHPSNALIAMDGDLDIENALKLIDEKQLSTFEKLDINPVIGRQESIERPESTVYYEIGRSDSPKNRTFAAFGYMLGDYADMKRYYAARILCDYLAGSSESPLSRAVADSGLASGVSVNIRQALQHYINIQVSGTEKAHIPEIERIINTVIAQIAEKGLNRQKLEASFNAQEFEVRTRRTEGSVGLNICRDAISSWCFGSPVCLPLNHSDVFEDLRKKMDEGYFEALLLELFICNREKGRVCVLPSVNVGTDALNAEAAALAAAKAEWTDEKISEVIRETKDLIEWQSTPDSPEILEKIPSISISDISELPAKNEASVSEENGFTVLHHSGDTGGLMHLNAYFDISDINKEDLPYVSLMASLLGKLNTGRYSAAELQTLVSTCAGRFEIAPEAYSPFGKYDRTRIFVSASVSALGQNAENALDLLCEVLTATEFASHDVLRSAVRQGMDKYRADLLGRGPRAAAAVRSRAYTTTEGVVLENTIGYEYYSWLKKLEIDSESVCEDILSHMKALAEKMFVRSRLTLSAAGENARDAAASFALKLPEGKASAVSLSSFKPMGPRQEGILIPAAVSFASGCGNIFRYGAEYSGGLSVLSQLLHANHLWKMIRVQGGAYGGGLNVFTNGDVLYNSFRDPTAYRSIDCFNASADFARSFCGSGADLRKIIIGALGNSEGIMGPIARMKAADSDHFCGITYEDRCRMRSEMLNANNEELIKLCAVLDAVKNENAVCVVGGKQHLDACAHRINTILEL